MKKFTAVTLLTLSAFLLSGCAAGRIIKDSDRSVLYNTAPITTEETSKISPPTAPIETGVTYKYSMSWLKIPVATVTFEVADGGSFEGKDVFRLTMKAVTNRFASQIYRVDDTYTSYVDKEKLIPLAHDVARKEGTYRKTSRTRFDHENGIAYFENFLSGDKKTYKIPYGVQDPLSAVIKIRSIGISPGKMYVIDVANNEQVYNIRGFAERKDEVLVENIGSFEAYYIAPYAMLNNEIVKKGTVSLYISSGRDPILICGEAKAPLFTKMTVSLIEIARK
jgi:hypothetical protein